MKQMLKSEILNKLKAIESKIEHCKDLNDIYLYYQENDHIPEEKLYTTEGQIINVYIYLLDICKEKNYI
jgi:hypothetical protein